ncbi:MAG: relaxase/mobilization nuclease domain-containing protein [Alphaproteobacteria bacterium]|nr:relaxase/mobilization nuclease domain-containing protein [Alphaproteobacteria bacterium]
MILVGNQRGGAKNLALHLLKEENERVELHELKGFCSDNLIGALNESYAISRATKCKQHLFSLSLNPPPQEQVSTEDFEHAINRVEEKLGLAGQPRAIVFHTKENRTHCHAVWSRINLEEMKAVQLSFSKQKMQEVSRELYLEHGWQMPRGLVNTKETDPRNFTLAEWQQAKRLGKDAREIKGQFQDAWAISDSKAAFSHALEERGYKLARGDRRGFVAVDHKGEVYPVSRWAGVKTKQVKDRLGDIQELPSVADARTQFAQEMMQKIQEFQKQVEKEKKEKARKSEEEQQRLAVQRQAKQEELKKQQLERQQEETEQRKARLRKGFLGLWDRIRGENKRIEKQNRMEALEKLARERLEKETLLQYQLTEQKRQQEVQQRVQQKLDKEKQELQQDTEHFQQMKSLSEEEQRKAFMEKRRSYARKDRIRGPTIER